MRTLHFKEILTDSQSPETSKVHENCSLDLEWPDRSKNLHIFLSSGFR